MRFLVDAQLPPLLAAWIAAQGHEAKALRDVGLRDADDETIWRFAKEGKWVVVSKDEDFVDFVLSGSSGPLLIWLRVGNCTNPFLLNWLRPLWPEIIRAIESDQRVVEVREGLS